VSRARGLLGPRLIVRAAAVLVEEPHAFHQEELEALLDGLGGCRDAVLDRELAVLDADHRVERVRSLELVVARVLELAALEVEVPLRVRVDDVDLRRLEALREDLADL